MVVNVVKIDRIANLSNVDRRWGYMIKNEWYNLTADELREVVDSPKNSGIKGSILTFIVVMVNVLPVFFKNPVKFTKTYIHIVLRNFIQR